MCTEASMGHSTKQLIVIYPTEHKNISFRSVDTPWIGKTWVQSVFVCFWKMTFGVSEFQDNGQQTTCRKNSEGKTKQNKTKLNLTLVQEWFQVQISYCNIYY